MSFFSLETIEAAYGYATGVVVDAWTMGNHPLNSGMGISNGVSSVSFNVIYSAGLLCGQYKKEGYKVLSIISKLQSNNDKLSWLLNYYDNENTGARISKEYMTATIGILILKRVKNIMGIVEVTSEATGAGLSRFGGSSVVKLAKKSGKALATVVGAKEIAAAAMLPLWLGNVMNAVKLNRLSSNEDLLFEQIAYIMITGDQTFYYFRPLKKDSLPKVYNGTENSTSTSYRLMIVRKFLVEVLK